MREKFDTPGQLGLNNDLAPDQLPDSDGLIAWTSARNVRMRDGKIRRMRGHSSILGAVPIAPYGLAPAYTATNRFYLALGLAKVHAYNSNAAAWSNITRQTASVDVDYTGGPSDIWTWTTINGIPILNNGVDAPQMWQPVGTPTKLQALTAWPVGFKAKALRSFKNYLLAFDVTSSVGVRLPNLVKWSTAADTGTGTVPSTWDETNPAEDAGFIELGDAEDRCIDALALRDSLIIYKANSTWAAQLVGGFDVFNFSKLFTSTGMFARNCVVEIQGRHVVLTSDDLIAHSGGEAQSIIDARNRRWLFQQIDATNFDRTFLVANHAENEVWICYPQQSRSECTQALIWNYRADTYTVRDLPSVRAITPVTFPPGSADTVDTNNLLVDASAGIVDNATYSPISLRLAMASPSLSKIFQADTSNARYDNDSINATVERQHMKFGDENAYKTVSAVYLRASTETGQTTPVQVYIGGSANVNESIAWQGPFAFNVGIDFRVPVPYVTGRLISFRLTMPAAVDMVVSGIDFEYHPRGDW